MASKKRSKQNNQSPDSRNNGFLRSKLNGIAIALLTALVTEIVQQVIDRLFNAQSHSAQAANDGDEVKPDLPMTQAKLETSPVAAAGAVNDRVHQAKSEAKFQTKPLMQDVLKTIQTTIEEATPRLNEAIAVLQASSNDSRQTVATLVRDAVSGTKESLDTATASAAPNFDDWMSRAMNATQAVIDRVSPDGAAEPEKKGKKKKGKKKKGKKSKK